jgi:hypothetical protein
MMKSLLDNLFDFERAETPGEVLFARLFEGYVAWCVIYLSWEWGAVMQTIRHVVKHYGIAVHLDISFMLGGTAGFVNAALITVLVVLGFFRIGGFGRFGYLVAFPLLHLQYVARFTPGEMHNPNLMGLVLLGLALGQVCFHEPRLQRRFMFGMACFFVGLGYTLAACSKLVASGPTWPDGLHLWMWVHEKALDQFAKEGHYHLNTLQQLVLDSRLLATGFLTVGMLSEALAFTFWWRRFRPWVGLALLGLHVGIFLVMNIQFRTATTLILLLAFPWGIWLDRVRLHKPAVLLPDPPTPRQGYA